MKELSKSIQRRLSDSNYLRNYFKGEGVDIGGKPDPLKLYQEFFPLMIDVRTWDWEDGDAQFMHSMPDESLDFVHSSHCLEHLVDPIEGFKNWFRILRPGGFMIVTVPDEDLYEQGVFPSEFNRDHKWTFTIHKQHSWSSRSLNLIDVVTSLGETAEIIKVELLSATYRFGLPRFDQTLTPVGECGIELIVRKRLRNEMVWGGRLNESKVQPEREMRVHFNQYRDDMNFIKKHNSTSPPFENDSEI